jgi:hypothetical protein
MDLLTSSIINNINNNKKIAISEFLAARTNEIEKREDYRNYESPTHY